ncbi:hypothetical protein KP509_03G069400 [Ceratopteris richardii]|uniref:Methyltransferase FkbM domain-containing protein n=1 Tax=Ceratopteris richardii TaxID=49495 RepID=A0A8T2V4E4_CERRI|nr:hypothetical protein KP509_03G069400 [Ceratopteris richardii]
MGSVSLVHPWILYFCIAFLTCYVVLDLIANHSDLEFPDLLSCSSSSSVLLGNSNASGGNAVVDEPAVCRTLEGHLDIDLASLRQKHVDLNPQTVPSRQAEDPWRQMKWVGPAATCRVRGHLIERLDPALNFRRGFSLRFASDVEDKTHLLPWLLPSRVNLNNRRRRVYLDLGANAFSTSITWFLRMYPVDFTEMHAFEVDTHLLRKPEAGFNEGSNYAPPNQWSKMLKETAGVPSWMLSRIRVYNQFVSDGDDALQNAVNITRFMKEELSLKPEDTVVVKMDIEGSEWPILRRWMQDPDMSSIVDELFVEVHYDHPSMRGYHWARFSPTTREQALTLLADLRFHGFFVHAWP